MDTIIFRQLDETACRYGIIPRQISLLLFCIAIAFPGNLRANEIYNCNFRDILNPHGQHSALIQVRGMRLNWQVLQPASGSAGMQAQEVTYKYQLLTDNSRGLAALASDIFTDRGMGAPFGVNIIVLEKQTGRLRMGAVLINGAHDLLDGICKRS